MLSCYNKVMVIENSQTRDGVQESFMRSTHFLFKHRRVGPGAGKVTRGRMRSCHLAGSGQQGAPIAWMVLCNMVNVIIMWFV